MNAIVNVDASVPGLFSFYLTPQTKVLFPVFAGLSFFLILVSAILPKILDKNIKQTADANLSTTQYYGSASSGSSLFYNWNQYKPYMGKTSIPRLAMMESISIFGFVLSFLTKTCFFISVFGMVAILFMFLWSPFFKKGCQ